MAEGKEKGVEREEEEERQEREREKKVKITMRLESPRRTKKKKVDFFMGIRKKNMYSKVPLRSRQYRIKYQEDSCLSFYFQFGRGYTTLGEAATQEQVPLSQWVRSSCKR